MKQESINEIVERYQARLKKYGKTFESLQSGSIDHQILRFNIQKSLGIKNGDSVLDIGCGLADFYKYLKDQDINVNYTGIDLVPELIEESSKRYPECDFQVRDILKKPLKENSFDFVVSSQAMNYKFKKENNIKHVKTILEHMYFYAKKGSACDFLTKYVDFEEDHLFYYKPEEIFSHCKSLTKRVDLIHSYPLFEFTIYMYANFEGWGA